MTQNVGAQSVRGGPPAGKRARPSFKNLGRAIRFLGHYRNITILAYLALFLSTAAQLMVPQMVQNILDSITQGMAAQQLAAMPANAQQAAMASARASAVAKRPPPGPSVPTKSVSQKRHWAKARSASRPLHRLQPAKRQNTAGRPTWAPSPCRVRKISLTEYVPGPGPAARPPPTPSTREP